MPLVISDETLRHAKLDEHEARVEIACLLYKAERLDLWPAAQLAGLSRVEMEDELMRRGIAVHRPTVEEVRADLESLQPLKSE